MKNYFIFILIFVFSAELYSQEKKQSINSPYRRSSLHIILMESENFLNKEIVMEAYKKAPFPDKYNKHSISNLSFNPKMYCDSNEFRVFNAFNKDSILASFTLEKLIPGYSLYNGVQTLLKPSSENYKKLKNISSNIIQNNSITKKEAPIPIKRYIEENQIAKKLIEVWFNRQSDGSLNFETVHERGSYDASLMEAQIANKSLRGSAILKDAGEELISKTFVVFNKMHFIKNDLKEYALEKAFSEIRGDSTSYSRIVDAAMKATQGGYTVITTSYLFQLEWNDELANSFYASMWIDKSNIDENKKVKFDTTQVFKLKYLGKEMANSLVAIGVGKSINHIIQEATIRNLDNVYTKLQKKYDVFKTKTPIYSTDPILAKIGLKEGIEPNEKYEVLEQVLDKKTGLTKYERITTVKANGNQIWDNRFNMEDIKNENNTGATLFNNLSIKNNIEPGMLLRQIK